MKSSRFALTLAIASFLLPGSAIAGLAASAETSKPLGVGAKAPPATVVTASGETINLAAKLAGKPTLLIFYRGGWCPYCNKHLSALSELEAKMVGMGYQILGVSPDMPSALAKTIGKVDAEYTLLSDREMAASAAYGLAFRVDAETVERYKGYGIELAPVPGEPDARWLPVPAAYVVDAGGVIRFVYTNSDYKTRVTSDEILGAAKAALE